jgi:hypothetical protein
MPRITIHALWSTVSLYRLRLLLLAGLCCPRTHR